MHPVLRDPLFYLTILLIVGLAVFVYLKLRFFNRPRWHGIALTIVAAALVITFVTSLPSKSDWNAQDRAFFEMDAKLVRQIEIGPQTKTPIKNLVESPVKLNSTQIVRFTESLCAPRGYSPNHPSYKWVCKVDVEYRSGTRIDFLVYHARSKSNGSSVRMKYGWWTRDYRCNALGYLLDDWFGQALQ